MTRSRIKPRPIHVVHYYPRGVVGGGGPTLSVRGWIAGMLSAGAKVSLASDAHWPPSTALDRWIPVRHRGNGRWRFPVGLASAVGEADVVILHSAWVFNNIVAARRLRRENVPYVVNPHGGYHPMVLRRRRRLKRLWLNLVERRMLASSLAVHVFFEEEEEHLKAIGYAGPTVVAPNGMEYPHPDSWDGGSGGYGLWLGRYDIATKGLDLLVEAVRLLPEEKRPSLRLHGPDSTGGRRVLSEQIAALSLRRWITLGDAVEGEEKWNLLKRAAFFVYPSRWDGHSIAVSEAVSVGVPILTTKSTQIGRVLAAKGVALVTDPNPESLASGLIRRMALDSAPSKTLMDEVRAEYSWTSVADRFLEQAERLLL